MPEQLPVRMPDSVAVIQHVPVDLATLARVREGLLRWGG